MEGLRIAPQWTSAQVAEVEAEIRELLGMLEEESLMTLKVKGGPQRTPAMAAGLTDHVWTIEELTTAAAGV